MGILYAEDVSVFRCTVCGNLMITEIDEQPPEECENEKCSTKVCNNIYCEHHSTAMKNNCNYVFGKPTQNKFNCGCDKKK